MPIEFTEGAECVGVSFGGADILITGGTLRLIDCKGVGNLRVDNGALHATDLQMGGVLTLDAGTGESVEATNLQCNGLDLNGGSGFQNVIINGLRMRGGQLKATGTFYEFSITSTVLGEKFSSTASQSIVSFDGVTSFRLEALIYRSARHGAVFNACNVGDVFATIIDPSSATDNTYDGISLTGINDRLNFYGSIRGAVNQTNNPRYAIDAAAATLRCDVWMTRSGYQTGDINDASGTLVVH